MSYYGSFVLQCYVLHMRVMTSTVGGNLTNRPAALRHIHVETLLFMLAATLKPIRLECYLPRLSGANKVGLFRADSLARYLLHCAWDSCVVAMDKTFVGLTL